MNKTTSLIITSYNIHKGMSPLNRFVRVQGIADALKAVNPDILCLQEVQGQNLKRMVKYNEFPDQSQHEWFGEFLKLENSYGKNCEYDNGHHGNAVLSRYPLDPKHNVNITVNKLEQRGVLHCEVQPLGWEKPVVVLCAHLNLFEHDRQKQYQTIMQYVRNEIAPDQPLILAGDFNDWKKRSCDILTGELGMTEAFQFCHHKLLATFPAMLPILSLDRIYVRNLQVKRAWVHTGKPWSELSDHLPISAEIIEKKTTL
ncbi:endonuclease/exonuclease/phosphatase family protein [Psychrobacter sp. I-STPA6b]|uniref:endonuclease/exonuclease/phosphatase family protein n=1 Tax=Psychrobacter sp. I-STPA6b TaxID=2585718 RepID=UPI001D0C8431|nr:endonuclease/exonuclease/phosphatase family protein [Psychrobacter sp. I-STPA6b]